MVNIICIHPPTKGEVEEFSKMTSHQFSLNATALSGQVSLGLICSVGHAYMDDLFTCLQLAMVDVLPFCRNLADSSRGLQTAMDMVLSYEQRSHTALAHLLGRAWTAGDLIFHAACGMAVLCAGALHARLPVLAIWLCNHLLERFLVGACSPLLSFNQDGQVSFLMMLGHAHALMCKDVILTACASFIAPYGSGWRLVLTSNAAAVGLHISHLAASTFDNLHQICC